MKENPKCMLASSARSVSPAVEVESHDIEVVPSFNNLVSKRGFDNNLEATDPTEPT